MTTRSCPAVLLAVAISAAGCARQVHPIGQGRAYEPDEREQRLWETSRAASSQYQSSGAMYDDPELHTYVNTVMGRLLADRGETYYLPLRPRVFILDSPSVNAFAFAHGDIFVHTGVLGRLRNEAQLAMLLGHEITHATHRHMYQELEHVYEATAHHGYMGLRQGNTLRNWEAVLELQPHYARDIRWPAVQTGGQACTGTGRDSLFREHARGVRRLRARFGAGKLLPPSHGGRHAADNGAPDEGHRLYL